MIHLSAVFHIIGKLLLLLAIILLIPTGIALYNFPSASQPFWQSELFAFIVSDIVTLLIGFLLQRFCRYDNGEIGVREGFAVVTLAWIILAFFGSLPFYISNSCPTLIDSYFETMSGFTTTGATVITDIEALPRGVLFWRSLTHWLGGMGIVALSVAILPVLGAGGYQLMRAEVPGPTTDRLTPRIAETAKMLWLVYVALTTAQTVLLMLGGMPLYDSLCHAFGTLATGGFSTQNASIGQYDSAYFDAVTTIFMILAGCNFVLHYHLFFKGNWRTFIHNAELRAFLAIILVATVFITILLYTHDSPEIRFPESDANHAYDTITGAFRYASFQVASIITTTGYCTANFDAWPVAAKYILIVLMFFGGCAGSTGGGIKIIRLIVIYKAAVREIYKLISPKEIFPVKISGDTIPPQSISNISAFVVIFLALFAFFTIVMACLGLDVDTSFSSVAATLGNIGPGLAGVGAYANYAWISPAGKLVLTLCMLLGRLEIYSVLVLLVPWLWKRY